jgi:hypothetical protein
VDLNVRDPLLIILPAFFRCLRKIGINWDSISFRTAYDSLRSEVVFNILLWFNLVIELVRAIKMPSIEKYNEIQIADICFTPLQNGLKIGDSILLLLFSLL